MQLKKTDWIFVLVAGGVIATLIVLSLVSRKPKPVLAIPEHATVTIETTRVDCLVCHDPTVEGTVAPLKPVHPHVWKKEQVACTTCHVVPEGGLAQAAGKNRER
ncbi:MAG: hypothetical protein IPF53_21685 [Blastocatellia bacterium]|nr:hypothetical protein [Blastocatellia bacterium]